MPKQQLNITDFTGGLNCYSDARDIKENQFAQNWNASLDKYGVIRYTGAGTKHITNHPHTNTTFVPGGGLFSFGYDELPNTIPDSGNFSIPHEEGTAQEYSATLFDGSSIPGIKLAASSTKVSATDHATDNYYNNMIISIIDGPGKGQSRLITDYTGSSKIAKVAAFDTYSSSNATISAIDGTSVNTKAIALLRAYNFGVAGSEFLHNSKLFLKSNNKIGIITFSTIDASALDPSALITSGDEGSDYSTHGTHAAATININDRSAAEVAGDIVSAINNIDDISSALDFTAAAVSDGSANTIVKITDDTTGSDISRLCNMIYADNRDPSKTIDIFQPFQSGFGIGSSSSNTIAKVTATSHTLNAGEYITIAGADSAYNTTFQVLWVETNAFYISTTEGDPTDGSGSFTSVPTSASKYIIYNIKSSSNSWSIDGEDDTYDCYRLFTNKSLTTDVAVVSEFESDSPSKFLSSSVEVATANTAGDLGYLELPAQSLYPGVSYELEFKMSNLALWQMFLADGNNTDILPGVLIYSPTAGDGTKDGVLMADGKWIISDEPVSGNELSPFTNKIVNGDFNDITDTTIHVNEGSGETASNSDVTVTVDTTNATSGNSLGKIFTTSAGLPIGVCTAVNSTTEIVFTRLESDLADDAELHTLDGWTVEGTNQFAIPLPNTIMETDKSLGTSTANSFAALPTVEQTDGGPDGGNALLLLGGVASEITVDSHYIYQDIELDGNCYYHLYFKYATGEALPGIAEMRYDVYNKETSNSLLNGWQTTSTEGKSYLAKQSKDECYYRHVNQSKNQGDGNFSFQYVTFFVPPLETEANSVTVSIRFSSLSGFSPTPVALSAVSVKKAFPDVVTMVNQQGQGNIPTAFDYGHKLGQVRESRRGFIAPSENIYKLNFRVPSTFKEKTDWIIRLYGGRFGYTTGSATATTNHSKYSQIQAVGFNDIKLKASYIDKEGMNKNVILLNDNLANKSKIYAYYEEFGFWDKEFMEFDTPNVDPNYIYVNGMLQISDRNFSNENDLRHYFYYDKTTHANTESGYASTTTKKIFDFIDSVSISELVESSENQKEINHGNIMAMHHDIWNKERHTILPPDSQGRCQYNQDGADNYNTSFKPWHYEWADYDVISSQADYVTGLAKTPQTIPVKWVAPNLVTPHFTSHQWNNAPEHFFDHYRTQNRQDTKDAFLDKTTSSQSWITGGLVSTNKYALNDGEPGDAWDDSEAHIVNNPIYLPISGSDGAVNMKTSLKLETGYDIDGGAEVLHLSKLEFTLHMFMSGIARVSVGLSGQQSYEYTKDLKVPKIKIGLYKLNTTINDSLIRDLFDSNPEQYLDSINFGGSGSNTTLTYPNPSSNLTFNNHGSGNTKHGTYMSYNDDFTPASFPLSYSSNGNHNNADDGFAAHTHSTYSWQFDPITVDGETFNSDLTTEDNLILRIEVLDAGNGLGFDSVLGRVGTAIATSNWQQDIDFGEPSIALPQSFGYVFQNSKIRFYQEQYNPDTDTTNASEKNVEINFDFELPPEETVDEDETVSLEGNNWAGRVYTVACTGVNIFDEESALVVCNDNVGETDIILAGEAPIMSISTGNELIRDKFLKKLKIYMKDNSHDIWYLQASIDTDTMIAKSSTSGSEYEPLSGNITSPYNWLIKRKDLLTFNEVDSYESETLVKQKDAESISTLTCQYKTAVHVNNRLYVGNVKQNGKEYGDRMLKSPVGKYNLFPASNYIDVAIQDGDSITALSYYKDRILQFKRKKVFVINVSGDYEYLEDTFENIGVNKQCQVAETPYGIVWVNAKGCFLYDGKKAVNLIDGKIGTEEFQSNPVGSSKNYWTIVETDIPAIGYVESTKKLIIARNTGPSSPGGTGSVAINAVITEGFQYDFQSQGWTFLYKKLTATPETATIGTTGYLSNFTNNKNGDIIYYAVDAPSDSFDGINAIYKWTDDSTTSSHGDGLMDNFFLRTKDFDFGSPGVRKKIYKVYVTFKSTNGGSAAHSKIRVYHATNGSSTFTEFSNDSVNYSTTNGLSDGASGTGWITAELKPTSSINNIYSFAMKFEAGASDVADGFEINDYTIVYRIKNVK